MRNIGLTRCESFHFDYLEMLLILFYTVKVNQISNDNWKLIVRDS